jgi:LmbE family N-acetylglucosaminyl deacetylase
MPDGSTDVELSGTEPLLVVSPHLDDGVFGCGELLAAHPGSTVITVFAGRPDYGDEPTEWDRSSGFHAGDDVVGARRMEDRAALAVLGASPLWLDFLDSQYLHSPTAEEIAPVLADAIRRVQLSVVLFPLGLFHSDHELVHQAGLLAMELVPERRWFGFEDAMYRRVDNRLEERLRGLEAAGDNLRIARTDTPRRVGPTRRAIEQYASQLRALATPGRPGHADAFEPERYWRLARVAKTAHVGASGEAARVR